jgi:N-acyl-D-aspartate/D-glutamate deacylase
MAELNAEERATNGGSVWPQITPRPLIFQVTMVEPFTFNVAPCFAELMPAPLDVRKERYADPAWRAKAVQELDNSRIKPRWEAFRLGESTTYPELQGRRIAEIAEAWGCHSLDVMCKIALDDDMTSRFHNTLANDDEQGVAYLLQQDHLTLGLSDAGAHVGQICDAPQATDLLGKWVRERGVITVEQAVRKLSGQQADIFGFEDRGYLRAGAYADVTVFDLTTPTASRQMPRPASRTCWSTAR